MNGGVMMRFVARGLAVGAAAASVAFCFQAYLDPSVFVPVSTVLSLCR